VHPAGRGIWKVLKNFLLCKREKVVNLCTDVLDIESVILRNVSFYGTV
jgi:hypothetical protein